jgi:hypothetical protein
VKVEVKVEVMELALKAPTRRKRRVHHHAEIVRTGFPALRFSSLVSLSPSHRTTPAPSPCLRLCDHVEPARRRHEASPAQSRSPHRKGLCPGHRSLLLLPSSRNRSRLLLSFCASTRRRGSTLLLLPNASRPSETASRTPTRTPEAAPASPAPESVWERAGRVGNLDFDGGLADSLVGSAPIIDRKHKGATEKDDDYVATRISWRAGRGGENEVRTNPAPVALTPEFALRAA